MFELLADSLFLKAISLEKNELCEIKHKENEEQDLGCNPDNLRQPIRLLYLVGRLILAIAILKEYLLLRCCIKNTHDIKNLQSTYKILIGEWIIVLGTALTYIGAGEEKKS
ncbi:hypothetical protein SH2C18_16420 [Clostridium sediminicola]|uniref:hypothetical protein n=1 Tax=Clostridium sediminicola TaxID=3114879 RepID=UPI0031F1E4D2